MAAFLTIDPNKPRPNVPTTPLEALQLALDKSAPSYVSTADKVKAAGGGGTLYDAQNDPRYPVSAGYLPGTWANPPTRSASVMIPGMTQQQKQAINYIDPRIPASVYNGRSRMDVASVPNAPNGSAVIKDEYGRATPEMGYYPMAPQGAPTNPAVAAIQAAMPPLPRVRPNPPSAPGGGSYTVQKGDTFWGISQRTGVPVSVLMANAGISDPRKLQVGTRLNVGSSPTKPVIPASPTRAMTASRQSSSDQKGQDALRAAGWMDEFGMLK